MWSFGNVNLLPANEEHAFHRYFTETNNSRQNLNTAVDTPWFPIDYDCLIAKTNSTLCEFITAEVYQLVISWIASDVSFKFLK